MVKQILNKIISVLIILLLTSGNLMLVATKSYAEFEELEEQNAVSSNKNVSFDTYFYVEGKNVHSAVLDANAEAIINYEINVGEGYLKDTVIQLSNENYAIQSIESQNIEGIVNTVEANKITLNQINSNTKVLVSAKVKINKKESVDAYYLGKETTATFTSNYTNIKGKTQSINSSINIRIDWVADTTAKIETNVQKYMQINNKTIIEQKITSGINENVLPIKNTNIKIVAPAINQNLPEEVRVHVNNTKATNGKENGNSFNNQNYTYNKENGEITINVENQANQDGNVSWKNGTDEYFVTYIYNSQEIVTSFKSKAESTITLLNNSTVNATAENEQPIELTVNNVDFGIYGTQNIGKGYIYANSVYETQYNSMWVANVSYADSVENITFAQNLDSYVEENAKKAEVNTLYKNTKISKENFEKILGTEGKIDIYSSNNLVGTINKETKLDESGNYVFEYNAPVSNISITTSKPVAEGIISIINNKAISATSNYTFEQKKAFRTIESTLLGAVNGEKVQELVANTNLQETTSKATVQIGKEKLSTVVKNEDVEIRAVLEADDITDDLYKNPTIRIELPEEVESVNIKSANILFGNEMQITSINIENRRILNLALTGEQTQYITDGNKGITIVLNTDITLRKTSASKQTQVVMSYTNEKAIALENNGITATNVNISAPTGVITLNSVTNEKTGEVATSIESQEEEGVLERNVETINAKYTLTVINNNNTTISNAKVLGNIPSKGDKYNSTIDTKFVSKVTSLENANCTVFYSENLNATSDENNVENGWKTEPTENSKLYLIVINDNIEQGRELNFTYNIQLPANLEYGEKAISSYNVEYVEGANFSNEIADLNGTEFMKYAVAESNTTATIQSSSATPVALSTGNGPVLTATLEDSLVEGTAYVGNYVTYTVTIKNTGTEDARNVVVNMDVPDGMLYATDEIDGVHTNEFFIQEEVSNATVKIDSIKVNSTEVVKIYMYAKENISKNEVVASINCDNSETVYTNTLNTAIQSGLFDNIIFSYSDDSNIVKLNEEAIFVMNTARTEINNPENENPNLHNFSIEIYIPEEFEYNRCTVLAEGEELGEDAVSYSKSTRKLKIAMDEMKYSIMEIELVVTPLENNGIYSFTANIASNEGNESIKSTAFYVGKANTSVDVSSNIANSSYIKVGDSINYRLEFKNSGTISQQITPYIYFADEFEFSDIAIKVDGRTLVLDDEITSDKDDDIICTRSYYDNHLSILLEIPANGTLILEIEAPINVDYESEEEVNIKNRIIIDQINYEKEFEYKLEPYEFDYDDEDDEDNPNNPSNPSNPGGNTTEETFKISGTAWLDNDKNGEMGENENKLQGITVKAINSNGQAVKSTTTQENGVYTLEGLTKGNYTVIFEYDTNKYTLTTYQKEGIEESANSNVIKGKFEGKEVATSNTINITDRSIANINIGLIEGNKFDLSLSKKVTQISMVNTKTSKVKSYDTNLAKIDLDYKYINNTKVAVEYEIAVTNEGDIPGYASKIVDYLPTEFDFSTELNKDWYTSGNKIETKALEDKIINPGESQTITLVLTKNMTENDNGIVCNTAEIAEDYNEYGQEDIDSIPGNNKENEDDQSSANVILGLKTGGPITYITLTLSIMALICVSAYEINKRVLKV